MVWGALLGAGGSLLGGNASQEEAGKQSRLLNRYRKAFDQIGRYSSDNEQRAMEDQRGLSRERYADLETLAEALGGGQRLQVAEGARVGRAGTLNRALSRMPAEQVRGGASSRSWGQRAAGANAPALRARNGLLLEQAAQDAAGESDQQGFDQLGEAQADVGRRSAESSRRSQLMEGYLNKILSQEANRFKYTGPSNGFYNAQMISQLAQLGGTAIDSYGAKK